MVILIYGAEVLTVVGQPSRTDLPAPRRRGAVELQAGADNDVVQVTRNSGETVSLKLGSAAGDDVTLVGDLADVHRLVIEADRQLARLVGRFTGR